MLPFFDEASDFIELCVEFFGDLYFTFSQPINALPDFSLFRWFLTGFATILGLDPNTSSLIVVMFGAGLSAFVVVTLVKWGMDLIDKFIPG